VDTIPATFGLSVLTYGSLVAHPNHDCPDPMAPAGVEALTIESVQTDGTGLFTLCIARPDKLAAGLALGTDVKVVDAAGTTAGCSYVQDGSVAPTGTVKGTGVCKNGQDAGGFALDIDGTIGLSSMCGTTAGKVTATVSGTVAIGFSAQ
jgi:hypothetical protein